MNSGQTGDYFWLDSEPVLGLAELVKAIPDFVQGLRVVVTALDGGSLELVEDAKAAGWETIEGLPTSPPSPAPEDLPNGDYDEWYVFAKRPPAFVPPRFVNRGGFTLRPPDEPLLLDPTWDKVGAQAAWASSTSEVEAVFAHLHQVSPVSYLANGDRLVIATRVPRIFELFEAHLAP